MLLVCYMAGWPATSCGSGAVRSLKLSPSGRRSADCLFFRFRIKANSRSASVCDSLEVKPNLPNSGVQFRAKQLLSISNLSESQRFVRLVRTSSVCYVHSNGRQRSPIAQCDHQPPISFQSSLRETKTLRTLKNCQIQNRIRQLCAVLSRLANFTSEVSEFANPFGSLMKFWNRFWIDSKSIRYPFGIQCSPANCSASRFVRVS